MIINTEEKYINTPDGTRIALDHYRTGHNEVLIIAHGWFMSKDSRYFFDMSKTLSKNFDVITMDFRGHGKSSGFYTFTSHETQDIKAVVDYAKGQYEKVYLIGFSLGAALALIHSATQKDVDKVIAVSAPHSFRKIENHMWRKEAWSSFLKKFELHRFLSIRPNPIFQKKIPPIEVVDKVEAPTLFIAGDKDPIVYSWHTKSLFEKANCKKHFVLFKDGCHAEDLFIQEREKFINLCKNWLLN